MILGVVFFLYALYSLIRITTKHEDIKMGDLPARAFFNFVIYFFSTIVLAWTCLFPFIDVVLEWMKKL